METSDLQDKSRAVAFYDERYSHGYMDEWPLAKKRRVAEVIHRLSVPEQGQALDFGCGNGVFTAVLKQALPPAWKVYGTDISEVAVAEAQKRYPECSFFVADRNDLMRKTFTLLLTHHVLEHVYDLLAVLDDMDYWLTDSATMVHILPCGNEGSLEHRICLLRTDGIDSRLGNRFFFEDVGHLRRLTSAQLRELCRERSFVLEEELYGNQYYGAINWITGLGSSFIRSLTDPTLALDMHAKRTLRAWRYWLLFLSQLRRPAVGLRVRLASGNKSLRSYLRLAARLLLLPVSMVVESYVEGMAAREWKQRKKQRNGSEMYLVFRRRARGPASAAPGH